RLRKVDFSLLADLSSHKDASIGDIMNLIPLEGPLADAHRMSELQPDIKQLTLPIHRPEDQVVIGETSLSFTLSVSNSRLKGLGKVLRHNEDAQGNVQGNAASFPTVEFEKEELDTTPERDPPS
ncbi:hypothetical protein Tco_1366384, partial [Tanacetum coccineum]